MSGFLGDGRFQLTRTRAVQWHRMAAGCGCESLSEVLAVHLLPAGFVLTHRGLNFLEVEGPGLVDGDTGPLFAAVSGRESWSRDR